MSAPLPKAIVFHKIVEADNMRRFWAMHLGDTRPQLSMLWEPPAHVLMIHYGRIDTRGIVKLYPFATREALERRWVREHDKRIDRGYVEVVRMD